MIQYTPELEFQTFYRLDKFNNEVANQELMFERTNLANIILKEVKQYVPQVYHSSISHGNLVLDYGVKTFAFEVQALGYSFYFVGERTVYGQFGEPSYYNYHIFNCDSEVFETYHKLQTRELEQSIAFETERLKKEQENQRRVEEYRQQEREQRQEESLAIHYLPSGEIDFLRTSKEALLKGKYL